MQRSLAESMECAERYGENQPGGYAGTDKESLWESEEVYQFLICAVCPVNGDYEPGEPECGFLFPAFKDRSSDTERIDIYVADGDSQRADDLKNILLGRC